MLESLSWWSPPGIATFWAIRIARRWGGAMIGWILGKRYRSIRNALVLFRKDQGRGDLAARLIEIAPDIQKARGVFDDWRYDRNPRAMEAAVDAMVARLRAEGETPQTEKYLLAELAAMVDSVTESLPKDRAGVNDRHRFEWMVMCFEGM